MAPWRGFVVGVAIVLAAGACAPRRPAAPATVAAAGNPEARDPDTPAAALADLQAGNARYVRGAGTEAVTNSDRRLHTATAGQRPWATIVGCSDSRVPVEAIFDQGVGELFVVRVAGNVAGPAVIGSVEYGVEHLDTPLVVVMGHTHCGAVQAVVQGKRVGGSIPILAARILPAVERLRSADPKLEGEALVDAAVSENVRRVIDDLRIGSPELAKAAASGHVWIRGAVYDLGTGVVTWLDGAPGGAAHQR
jgi:carbonic anhydrase